MRLLKEESEYGGRKKRASGRKTDNKVEESHRGDRRGSDRLEVFLHTGLLSRTQPPPSLAHSHDMSHSN